MRYLLLIASVGCATATERTDGDAHLAGDAPSDGHPGACAQPISGALASWALVGQPGAQPTTPASTNAPGIVAGDLSRASALTPVSGADSINASGWSTAAMIDATTYYTVSITPPAGCLLDVSALTIDAKSSGSGPATAAVATNRDNFAQTSPVSTTAPSMPIASVTGATTALELRIYGFNASSGAGTMRLQNTLTITGALR